MRKLILITMIAMVLALAMVGVASANGGPHGGYTATTDACAGCHRAHTATGAKLLVAADTTALCFTCHGSNATGSVLNVTDGVLEATVGSNAGTALNGGGFGFYNGSATTSSHDTSGAATDAWGNGGGRGVASALASGATLSCASCHDPHGSSNYRILKTTVNNVTVAVAQVDEGSQTYDSEQWGTGQSNICAACHNDYHITAAGSGSDVAGLAATGGTAHRIGMPWNGDGSTAAYIGMGTVNPETGIGGYTLPLAGTNVECQTCHLPHGTASAMSGFAASNGSVAGDSALLRLDNRGVCEVCHQK